MRFHSAPCTILAATASLALGCGTNEPVLPGIPEAPLTPAIPETAVVEEPQGYVIPPGVAVDVQHLCGQPLSEVRAEVLAQLGRLTQSTELAAGKGEELQLERGLLRAVDDRIYMIRIPLPEPMRRADVMRFIGLPPQVGETIQTHREYRLNHERGIRRIRMTRQSRRNELVTEVEIWQFIPGEHIGRR